MEVRASTKSPPQGNGLTRGSGPTRRAHAPTQESAFRGVVPVGGQSLGTCQAHSAAPHQRQRKEEKVHSTSTKTPARTTPRTENFRKRRKHDLRVPRLPSPRRDVTSFSLLDRARPVFSFSSGRKRENGGCKGPAIFMAVDFPARQGGHQTAPLSSAILAGISAA